MSRRWRRPARRGAPALPTVPPGTLPRPVWLDEVLAVLGPGWAPLVRHAVAVVHAAGGDIRLTAVREKLGRLDLWWAGRAATDDAHAQATAALEALQDLSLGVCQACGGPAVAGGPWPHDSWTRTLCAPHQTAFWAGASWESLLAMPGAKPPPSG